jgi:hypothetical protein
MFPPVVNAGRHALVARRTIMMDLDDEIPCDELEDDEIPWHELEDDEIPWHERENDHPRNVFQSHEGWSDADYRYLRSELGKYESKSAAAAVGKLVIELVSCLYSLNNSRRSRC